MRIMQRSKTNRRVNKSVDHGKCDCLSCHIEKGEQYIKKKFEINRRMHMALSEMRKTVITI